MANKVGNFQGSGPFGSESTVTNKIAAAAINIGIIVGNSAAGSGEYDQRVNTTTTTNATLVGVVVGGDARGTYSGNPTSQATSAAGQGAQVCIYGRCIVAVNGSAATINIGDPIATDPNNAGYGIKGTALTNFIIGRALQSSTAFGDYILVDVTREGMA